MKFVRLRGGFATRADTFRREDSHDMRINPAEVVSVGLGAGTPTIAVTSTDKVSLYCDMTNAEVVAAFAAAGVDL
jgi:hypothetical protein